MQKLANDAYAVLTAPILLGSTTISITPALADRFPVADTGTDPVNTVGKDWFKASLENSAGAIEIIYVRTRALGSGVLSNVLRGQEGTDALAFTTDDLIEVRQTKDDIEGGVNAVATSLQKSGGQMDPGSQLLLGGDAVDPTEAVTLQQLMAAIKEAVPPGKFAYFARSTAPTGWLKVGSGTIGDAGSGATARADADTLDLYTNLWNEQSNTLLPIQDSTGALTSRGASAAADFAAHKRLPLVDGRGTAIRALDDGAGVDPGRQLGTFQNDAFEAHVHAQDTATLVIPGATLIASGVGVGISTGGTTASAGGTETVMKNTAWLLCIKL